MGAALGTALLFAIALEFSAGYVFAGSVLAPAAGLAGGVWSTQVCLGTRLGSLGSGIILLAGTGLPGPASGFVGPASGFVGPASGFVGAASGFVGAALGFVGAASSKDSRGTCGSSKYSPPILPRGVCRAPGHSGASAAGLAAGDEAYVREGHLPSSKLQGHSSFMNTLMSSLMAGHF